MTTEQVDEEVLQDRGKEREEKGHEGECGKAVFKKVLLETIEKIGRNDVICGVKPKPAMCRK